MKKQIYLYRLCLLVFFFGVFSTTSSTQAAESSGGEVSITSKITFLEGEKTPEPTPAPKPDAVTKPASSISLPQTGESIATYSLVALGSIILGLSFYVWKRNREEKV